MPPCPRFAANLPDTQGKTTLRPQASFLSKRNETVSKTSPELIGCVLRCYLGDRTDIFTNVMFTRSKPSADEAMALPTILNVTLLFPSKTAS